VFGTLLNSADRHLMKLGAPSPRVLRSKAKDYDDTDLK
jgi:hypothetical protein